MARYFRSQHERLLFDYGTIKALRRSILSYYKPYKLEDLETIKQLCKRFKVSRATFYKELEILGIEKRKGV